MEIHIQLNSFPVKDHCHRQRSEGVDIKARRKLIIASVLCLVFMICEVIGGVLSNSLAIATDAAHLLTDFASFMISLFAIWIAGRPSTQRMSFGWYRAEVIGALASVVMIWFITAILVWLAVERLINRDFEVDAKIMLITSGLAILVNLIFNSSSKVLSTTNNPTLNVVPTHPAPTNNAQYASVSDAPKLTTPFIFVTPPPPSDQTSFTQQMLNNNAIESNQMLDNMKIDYQAQQVQQAAYENAHASNSNFNNGQQKQQQQMQQYPSAGRAVDYRPAQQLEQFVNAAGKPNTAPNRPFLVRQPGGYAMRPQKAQFLQNGSGKVVPYPSYRLYQRPPQTLRRPIQSDIYEMSGGRAQISDRFTPGEAVASALFAQKGHKHHHHPPSRNQNQGNKVAAPSNFVQSFLPAKDLYAFPPNVNAKYPKPADDPKIPLPSSSINSYAPAPAGPVSSAVGYPLAAAASSDNGYKYPGPVSQAYLPTTSDVNGKMKAVDDAKPVDTGGDMADNDDTVGVLPASAMNAGEDNKADDATVDANGGMKAMDDMGAMPMDDGDQGHNHDHEYPLSGYDTGKEYPTPPPGWLEEHPDSDHFPHYSHHFPDIIYDDHHHYDFHHHDEQTHPPPTTVPPPPEPLPSEQPQEPRVKKYSYFYIGRKLWYIPLYFTVWFSFYVLWLILKSIARHKVNLPNHYVNRRSLPDYSDAHAEEYINQMTVSVLQQIEGFQNKYLTL